MARRILLLLIDIAPGLAERRAGGIFFFFTPFGRSHEDSHTCQAIFWYLRELILQGAADLFSHHELELSKIAGPMFV